MLRLSREQLATKLKRNKKRAWGEVKHLRYATICSIRLGLPIRTFNNKPDCKRKSPLKYRYTDIEIQMYSNTASVAGYEVSALALCVRNLRERRGGAEETKKEIMQK